MKTFETPEVKVTIFDVADVITTSDDEFIPPATSDNQTPYG